MRELRFQFTRSSGAGGQNVNKVNSRATLRWGLLSSRSLPGPVRNRLIAQQRRRVSRAGELVISSGRFRDQGRNVADCLERLRAMLLEAAVVPKPRWPTRRSRASVERRLESKRRRGQEKRYRRNTPEE